MDFALTDDQQAIVALRTAVGLRVRGRGRRRGGLRRLGSGLRRRLLGRRAIAFGANAVELGLQSGHALELVRPLDALAVRVDEPVQVLVRDQ